VSYTERETSEESLGSATFTDIDWEQEAGYRFDQGLPTIGLLVALVVVVVAFAYDYTVQPRYLVDALNWDLTRADWLFLVASVLFVRYGIVPLVLNRDRLRTQVRAFARHPAGVVSLVYILLFAVLGVMGPDLFFPKEYARLKYRFQPPVFAKFPMDSLAYYNCAGQVVNGYCHGSWEYPLGTTRIGQNVLKLILYGMRIALQIGFTAGMIMALVATGVGTIAGYYGGLVDDALMGYVNVQQTIPAIVVYIILSTMYLGTYEGVTDGRMVALILVFGLLNWGGTARLIRSGVLKRRETGYVRAAQSAGASNLRIMRRHIIPNSKATIVTSLSRQMPLLILVQVALAFLGINRVATQSLGRVLRMVHANPHHLNWPEQWWVSIFPMLFLLCTVVAFNVLGDVLRDVLDPQEEVN
jgi:peptide/nickel transport system permease protein